MMRPFFALFAVMLSSAAAYAQAPAQSTNPTAWHSHFAMVKNAYRLSEAQATQLETQLKALQGSQDEYINRMEITLRRMSKAIKDVLPKDNDIDDTERARVAARIQDQIYRIYAKGPLSVTNIVKKAEALVPQPSINDGRARLTDQLQTSLKGRTLDFENLDQFAIPPVQSSPSVASTPSTGSQVTQTAQKPTPPVTKPEATPAQKPPITSSELAQAHPPKNPPIKPIEPPQSQAPATPEPPPDPAPPPSQWATNAQVSAARYHFTDDQKKQLDVIIKSVQDRADNHMKTNKGEYDSAQKVADSNERTKKLETLNAPMDKLYQELTRRVDSLASLEQRLAAERGTPSKMADTSEDSKKSDAHK